ncbi:hypothetical protein [Catenuloplanes indicus]|uniref:Uncharacterized protein n=1 Tax=Catenuloplanes indicus TaxID=137267 RepID=A0AAE3W8P8_9ACTN|nr:hypothetical protein [Catenuloplanes indicus]MDQ0371589.1 hypothetical protein [Catenuloplanes indicus]
MTGRAPWAPPPTRRELLARIGRHLLAGTAAVAELVTPPPPVHRISGRHADRGAVYGRPMRGYRLRARVRLALGVGLALLVLYALCGACTVIL